MSFQRRWTYDCCQALLASCDSLSAEVFSACSRSRSNSSTFCRSRSNSMLLATSKTRSGDGGEWVSEGWVLTPRVLAAPVSYTKGSSPELLLDAHFVSVRINLHLVFLGLHRA